MMKKSSHYIRIPDEIKYSSILKAPFNEILIASTGFRCGNDRGIGYDVERISDEYLLKYCVMGNGWFEMEGKEYRISPGDLIICPGNHLHRYRADCQNPWSVYWTYFCGKSAELYYNILYQTTNQNVFKIGFGSSIENIFLDIYSILERGYAPHNLFHASNLFKTILSLVIIKMNPQHVHTQKGIALDEVLQYMMNHLYENITLDELAKIAGVSRDHLIRIFHKKYGYTPIDYFLRMKLQKACEMLITTDKPISEVSDIMGFGDMYYFSRIFKNKIGLSPSAYRNTYS